MEPIKNTGENENKLLQQLRDGDQRAFSRIYDKYWKNLYSYAFNRIRIKEVCEDIVQELFTDIWKRRNTLQIDNLSAYLHTSVRFLTYKQLNKLPLSHVYFQELELAIESYFSADGRLQTQELQHIVDSWIEALPEKRRKIFLLHYLEGQTTASISQELQISRKTVQNQLNTTRTELLAKYAHLLGSIVILTEFYKGL